MLSMTGYSESTYESKEYSLSVSLKSYNSRYLEIATNISHSLTALESEMVSMIRKKIRRGHVELLVKLKVYESSSTVNVDTALLSAYVKAFEEIGRKTGEYPSFSDYASIEGILVENSEDGVEKYKDALMNTLSDAIEKLLAEKKREGEGTYQDLSRLGRALDENISFIESKSGEMEEAFRNLLNERYKELMGDKELDEERLMSELALMLVKYSINEELKRLRVHLAEYFRLLEVDEPVGKKLDFLSQEMNRESNTIGSKSQMAEISSKVVALKDTIENIREQIRNIE